MLLLFLQIAFGKNSFHTQTKLLFDEVNTTIITFTRKKKQNNITPCPTSRFITLTNMTTTNLSTGMSCSLRILLKEFPRLISCLRQNGGTWVFSRVKDGCIT